MNEPIAILTAAQLSELLSEAAERGARIALAEKSQPEEWLTRAEVAKLINANVRTVDEWERRGYIRATRIGGIVRYNSKKIRNFLNN